mmetsp:Transcript_10500/g.23623  ORF Transcript_10500/g.23623 Transcript_10500/m.23623 type:complete len:698 (-) Transcript_10500:75-2168(-)
MALAGAPPAVSAPLCSDRPANCRGSTEPLATPAAPVRPLLGASASAWLPVGIAAAAFRPSGAARRRWRRRKVLRRAAGFNVVELEGVTVGPGVLNAAVKSKPLGTLDRAAARAASDEEDPIILGEEPMLRRWLTARNCEGVDCVDIGANGKPGVWLRAGPGSVGVSRDSAVLRIPREAWICTPAEAALPEVELAWLVLSERWLGDASSYAPYIDYLWRTDLSTHPVFWEDSELAWLSASVETVEEVMELRDVISARAKLLAQRADEPGVVVPPQIAGNKEAMEAEFRFATLLVEARGIEVPESADGDPAVMALVPLLDSVAHDSSAEPSCEVGHDDAENGTAMIAKTCRPLQPGEELRHCFEEVSLAKLFARYGIVPEANDQEEALKVFTHHAVILPVNFPAEYFQDATLSLAATKLEVLAENTGLDLREGASKAAARLSLPEDLYMRGRMLPMARFLSTALKKSAEQSEVEQCEALFQRLFSGHLREPDPAPTAGADLCVEVVARAIAFEWCERLLGRYRKALGVVLAATAPPEESEQRAKDSRGNDVPFVVGEVRLAHFKAKGPDGSRVKSRKPQEARVLAIGDGRVTVQFLSNGLRHQIPEDWIQGRPDPEEQESPFEPLSSLATARARLAFELLYAEAAVIELAYRMTQDFVKLGNAIMQDRTQGDFQRASDEVNELRIFWEKEQEWMRQFDS